MIEDIEHQLKELRKSDKGLCNACDKGIDPDNVPLDKLVCLHCDDIRQIKKLNHVIRRYENKKNRWKECK